MKLKHSFLIIAIATLTVACSGIPDGVLPKRDMARLMADIHTAECVIEANPSQYATDSSKRILRQSIYLKHGVTSEQVDSSLSWYGYHLDKYMEVYDLTVDMLEQRLADAREKGGSAITTTSELASAIDGDSVDVWPSIRSRRFSVGMPSQIITFALPADRYWEQGDVYTLQAKMLDAASGSLRFTLAVEYSDGSIDYLSRSMQGDGFHSLRVPTDSAKTAHRVYGTVSFSTPARQVAYIDSITLVRTRMYAGQERNGVKSFENRTQSNRTKNTTVANESNTLTSPPPLSQPTTNTPVPAPVAPPATQSLPTPGLRKSQQPVHTPGSNNTLRTNAQHL